VNSNNIHRTDMTYYKTIGGIFRTLFCLLIFITFFSSAETYSQQSLAEVAADKSEIEAFKQSLTKTISSEKERIDELNKQLVQIEQDRKALREELNAYSLQILAHNNLLMTPDPQIKDLEEARVANQSARINVSEKIKQFEQKVASAEPLILSAKEQQKVNEKQLREFQEQKPLTESLKSIIGNLQELDQLFSTKQNLLDKIQKVYKDNIQDLKETRDSLSELRVKLEKEIQQRQRTELFHRTSDIFLGVDINTLYDEISQAENQLRSIFSKNYWETEFAIIWRSDEVYFAASFILFGLSIFLFFRLGRIMDQFIQRPEMENFPWGLLTLSVFRRSLFLVGLLVFGYGYAQVLEITPGTSSFHLVLTYLYIFLFTKWPIDVLKLWNKGGLPQIKFTVRLRIRLLIDIIRYFAIAYVTIEFLVSNNSSILVIGRFVFEVSLLIWTAFFWRLLRRHASDFFSKEYKGIRVFRILTGSVLYLVAGVGLILELSGWGKMALYWYTSWGQTAIVLMWSVLLFLSLRELAQKTAPQVTYEYSDKPRLPPTRWLAFRLSWVLLALFLFLGASLSWGAKQHLLTNIVAVLKYPLHVGQMRFSLLNFVYAFLIIVITKARFWQHIVRDKLLSDSGIEYGLQDSVVSISSYLIWGLGILIALFAFGLDSTSLAVALGALGIGLGFGLQNIFNNFISGIILLFERPIQVGDAVEINGTWGVVRKINVRSTQVQTYDNAALIIPNADFISSQVTNWSFKDLRLRCTISVGVAYGSDIYLVKKTLEEIADKIHDVLKYPKPEVLFSDFGDSALIFRLRVWTNLDFMLTVPSQIRFEINQLFNEKGIEIAFPQRDLHIRTVDKEAFWGIKAGEKIITEAEVTGNK